MPVLRRYGPAYLWGQLSSWFKQNVADPGASLSVERRGTLCLPDVDACYATQAYDNRVGAMRACMLCAARAVFP